MRSLLGFKNFHSAKIILTGIEVPPMIFKTHSRTFWQYLGLLPLLILFFDYIESALLLSLLHYYPVQLPVLASIAGYITFSKNMFGVLSFMALGFGLVALLQQWLRISLGSK